MITATAYDVTSGAIDALFWVLVNGLVVVTIWMIVRRIRRGSVVEYLDDVDTIKIENPQLKMGVYLPPPGWLADPVGAAEKRYWDGDVWTNRVKGRQGPRARKVRMNSLEVVGSASGSTREVDAHSKLDDIGSQIRLIAQLHADGFRI
jgi:hypothetical protein